MTCITRRAQWPLAAVLVTLLSACAATPDPAALAPEPFSDTCDVLIAELARTEQARHDAEAKQQGAWKALIPFAVVGRFASGKSEEVDARQRLQALHAGMARQGCAPVVG
jgi:hypothetical protein